MFGAILIPCLLAVMVPGSLQQDYFCEAGFSLHHGYCLNKHVSVGGDWSKAKKDCYDLGADLDVEVTLVYPWTNDDLANWQQAIIDYLGGGYNFAGASKDRRGHWKWVSGTTVPTPSAWASEFPKDGEDCAWIYYEDAKLRSRKCEEGLEPLCQHRPIKATRRGR